MGGFDQEFSRRGMKVSKDHFALESQRLIKMRGKTILNAMAEVPTLHLLPEDAAHYQKVEAINRLTEFLQKRFLAEVELQPSPMDEYENGVNEPPPASSATISPSGTVLTPASTPPEPPVPGEELTRPDTPVEKAVAISTPTGETQIPSSELKEQSPSRRRRGKG